MTAPARAALLLGCAALWGCGDAPEPRGTNVFLISLDSASARYVEPYGADPGSTPHLARLAEESVVFENAYSQTATTVSSVASLLSGQRGTTHGIDPRTMKPLSGPTLAERLAAHGYRGYGFIANPMAGLRRLGFHRGFDVYLQIYAHSRGSTRDNPRFVEGSDFKVVYPEDVQAAVDTLIERFAPTHNFAYLHYLQPHAPYDPPAAYRGIFAPDTPGQSGPEWESLVREYLASNEAGHAEPELIGLLEARYRANLLYADAGVGALLDALRRRGLYDEALIAVTADHGEAFFGHGRFGHNDTLYDDMTRVPLLLKFPARDGIAPARLAQPTETVDLLPTLLDYLRLPAAPDAEGESLWPLISGARTQLERPEVVLSTAWRDLHAIRLGRHKLIVSNAGRSALYDLEEDPGEQRDLAASEPEVAAALREKLAARLGEGFESASETAPEWELEPGLRDLLETLGYAEFLPEAEPAAP